MIRSRRGRQLVRCAAGAIVAGGTLVNVAGDSAEKGTWGVASPWCDYSARRRLSTAAKAEAPPAEGTAVDTVTEGLAIFQHPRNRWYPSRWFTRDYGFFSPTPMYWLEGDRLVLSRGEPLTLRYRVIVHAGDAGEAGIAGLFAEYAGAAAAGQAGKAGRGR